MDWVCGSLMLLCVLFGWSETSEGMQLGWSERLKYLAARGIW